MNGQPEQLLGDWVIFAWGAAGAAIAFASLYLIPLLNGVWTGDADFPQSWRLYVALSLFAAVFVGAGALISLAMGQATKPTTALNPLFYGAGWQAFFRAGQQALR